MSRARHSLFRSLTAAVLLAASVPGAAQESDNMASRMLLELQQMREEVRELRGMVEAQAREIENLKRRQRDQYVDLDRRISTIGESGAAAPSTSAGPANGTGAVAATGSGAGQGGDTPASGGSPGAADARGEQRPGPAGSQAGARPTPALPEVREPIQERPEVAALAEPDASGARELEQPGESEQQAYDQAFLALRETRYADAAEGFDRFLRDHPDSTYAPNALYWLGEVYYVTRDFETALEQFQRLQQTYPESNKQPDALLKVGFSHYELGHWDRARAALEQVIADYPGTNYSRLAENRLRTMRLEGNL